MVPGAPAFGSGWSPRPPGTAFATSHDAFQLPAVAANSSALASPMASPVMGSTASVSDSQSPPSSALWDYPLYARGAGMRRQSLLASEVISRASPAPGGANAEDDEVAIDDDEGDDALALNKSLIEEEMSDATLPPPPLPPPPARAPLLVPQQPLLGRTQSHPGFSWSTSSSFHPMPSTSRLSSSPPMGSIAAGFNPLNPLGLSARRSDDSEMQADVTPRHEAHSLGHRHRTPPLSPYSLRLGPNASPGLLAQGTLARARSSPHLPLLTNGEILRSGSVPNTPSPTSQPAQRFPSVDAMGNSESFVVLPMAATNDTSISSSMTYDDASDVFTAIVPGSAPALDDPLSSAPASPASSSTANRSGPIRRPIARRANLMVRPLS